MMPGKNDRRKNAAAKDPIKAAAPICHRRAYGCCVIYQGRERREVHAPRYAFFMRSSIASSFAGPDIFITPVSRT